MTAPSKINCSGCNADITNSKYKFCPACGLKIDESIRSLIKYIEDRALELLKARIHIFTARIFIPGMVPVMLMILIVTAEILFSPVRQWKLPLLNPLLVAYFVAYVVHSVLTLRNMHSLAEQRVNKNFAPKEVK